MTHPKGRVRAGEAARTQGHVRRSGGGSTGSPQGSGGSRPAQRALGRAFPPTAAPDRRRPRGGPSPGPARTPSPPPPPSPRGAMASLLCLSLLAAAAAATSPGRLVPFDLLYADGVRAYLARDWARAAELLQRALHSYAGLRAARRACRAACARQEPLGGGPGRWEAALLGPVLQRARCLQQCLGRRLRPAPSAHRASRAVRRDFERREPYNYLQVAFFQVGTGPGHGWECPPPGCCPGRGRAWRGSPGASPGSRGGVNAFPSASRRDSLEGTLLMRINICRGVAKGMEPGSSHWCQPLQEATGRN